VSFAKIAEARAVKKIVAFVRQQAAQDYAPSERGNAQALKEIADDIEDGFWKDFELRKHVKLPKPKPRKKAKSRKKARK
jgi:hypothetical protein